MDPKLNYKSYTYTSTVKREEWGSHVAKEEKDHQDF